MKLGPPRCSIELAGDRQHRIAHAFRLQPPRAIAPQQPIIGIDRQALRPRPRRLLIRRRVTISRCSSFRLHLRAINSLASQSSNSGCDGRPAAKAQIASAFRPGRGQSDTATRDSRSCGQRAGSSRWQSSPPVSPRRSASAASGCQAKIGSLADSETMPLAAIISPGCCTLPRSSSRITGGDCGVTANRLCVRDNREVVRRAIPTSLCNCA